MNLGTVLREARLDACMTMREVEMQTGIKPQQLCRLEKRGKSDKITFETVKRLAKVYRLSLDEIATNQRQVTHDNDDERRTKGRVLHGR